MYADGLLSPGTSITVVGGGAAGVMFAIYAAQHGAQVTLFERKAEILDDTSRKTPGRMTSGFHYMHLPTALTCLATIIALTREYPNFRRGEEKDNELPEDHPMRRGRYFILKDSNVPAEEILATYNALQKEYERLVALDKENAIFGDKLFHILEPHEYDRDVDAGQIAVGIETREHLLNFELFRKFLFKAIDHLDITVNTKHELIDVKEGPSGSFKLAFKINGCNKLVNKFVEHPASYVINATWSEIDRISQMAGFPMAITNDAKQLYHPRTNRLKVLAKVNLPDALKSAHHMFFCMGPDGSMFSNNGDGTGFITHAQTTNIAAATGLTLDDVAVIESEYTVSIQAIKNGDVDIESHILFIGNTSQHRLSDVVVVRGIELKLADIRHAPPKMTYNDKTNEFDEDNSIIKVLYRPKIANDEKVWDTLELPLDETVTIRQGVSISEVLKNKLSNEQQQSLGKKLIEGVATRIPAMKDATLIKLNFGIVQTEGEYDPNNVSSAYHKRDYYGIHEQQIGWINLAGVKLMFTPFAATLAFSVLCQQNEVNMGIHSTAINLGLTNATNSAFCAVARNRLTSYDLGQSDCKISVTVSNSYGRTKTEFKAMRDNDGQLLKQSIFKTLHETGARHAAILQTIKKNFKIYGENIEQENNVDAAADHRNNDKDHSYMTPGSSPMRKKISHSPSSHLIFSATKESSPFTASRSKNILLKKIYPQTSPSQNLDLASRNKLTHEYRVG